jgi:hypothetical protein
MNEAEPEDNTPSAPLHTFDRSPEDGTSLEVLQADQDRPVLTIIKGKGAATTALQGFDKDEERPWWSAPDADEEFRRRFCVPDEAIAWLASGDELFAARYGGSDGKENRRLDALYPSMSKVAGDAWAAAVDRLGDACSSGQVRSYRGVEQPLKPKFWLVRDVTDQDVADVLFDRKDLRRLLRDDEGSNDGDGPAHDVAEFASGVVAERQKQRKARIKLSPERIALLAALWVENHPGGPVKRDFFIESFQADTNCHRDSARKAYKKLPESRRLRRGKPAQQNRP